MTFQHRGDPDRFPIIGLILVLCFCLSWFVAAVPGTAQEAPGTSEAPPAPAVDPPPKNTAPPGKAALTNMGEGKITLKLKAVPVADVIRLIAEYAGLNVLIDNDVQQVMTIKLTEVPWEEALETVLEANSLARRRMGAVYKVAPRNKIEREEQLLLQSRRDLEDLEDLKIQTYTISYLPAASMIPQVEPLLSPRGSVRSNDRTNALIIKDIESKVAEILGLLRDLDKKVLQVIIEAKIVLAYNKALEELGVNWGGAVGMQEGSKYYGINGVLEQATGLPDITNGSVTLPSNRAVSVPTSKAPMGGIGFSVGRLGGWNLNMQLNALQENDDLKILSSPKLLVLDNESAIISQGKEVPYRSTTSYYTSTEFKKVELSLQVTPHITSAKSISLDVILKNDHLSEYTVDGQPIIDTQHITTTLLLENGETAVIGGILQKENRKVKDGVPFLSDIPGLGWLFKGKQNSKEKKELVIFLTPEIS